MAAMRGAAARRNETGRTRPVISASTMVAPSRWRAVSPLGLRCHGPNGSKPVTSTFIKKRPPDTYGEQDTTVPALLKSTLFGTAWITGNKMASKVEIFDIVNKQDWDVCEMAQMGVTSKAFAAG